MTLTVRTAARQLNEAYLGQVPDTAQVLRGHGVTGWMMEDDVMVILGQDSWKDWLFNSLDPFGVIGPEPPVGHDLEPQARRHGLTFHGGILEHARVVYDLALQHRPRAIIGHSLGGAAAQIAGLVLEVPVISFGAPRPCWSRRRDPRESNVLNVMRVDDDVTKLPPWPMGFRPLGRPVTLVPFQRRFGRDHQMPHYVSILDEGHRGDRVPDRWPG